MVYIGNVNYKSINCLQHCSMNIIKLNLRLKVNTYFNIVRKGIEKLY